ncbi:unnamed protein product, partial [Linum tenue]
QTGRPGRDQLPRPRVPRLLVRRHRRPPRGGEHQSLCSRVRPAILGRIWGEAAARNPRLDPIASAAAASREEEGPVQVWRRSGGFPQRRLVGRGYYCGALRREIRGVLQRLKGADCI